MGELEKNQETIEHINQVTESVTRTVLSFIPSGPILDSFINYRNNLKRERILNFSEKVNDAIKEIAGVKLNSSNFNTEDFVDAMESIYMRVLNTRSVYKLERFKNILVNKIIEPNIEEPLFMRYVQMLDQLDDAHIVILNNFLLWEDDRISDVVFQFSGMLGGENKQDYTVKSLSTELDKDVSIAELQFYTNELVSLGLIRKDLQTSTIGRSTKTKNYLKISVIGKSFLKFIELHN